MALEGMSGRLHPSNDNRSVVSIDSVPTHENSSSSLSSLTASPNPTGSKFCGFFRRGPAFKTVGICASVILTGAFNNVLGKIRSKPLGAYDYFVSLFNALAYTLFYWVVLVRIERKRRKCVLNHKISISTCVFLIHSTTPFLFLCYPVHSNTERPGVSR